MDEELARLVNTDLLIETVSLIRKTAEEKHIARKEAATQIAREYLHKSLATEKEYYQLSALGHALDTCTPVLARAAIYNQIGSYAVRIAAQAYGVDPNIPEAF